MKRMFKQLMLPAVLAAFSWSGCQSTSAPVQSLGVEPDSAEHLVESIEVRERRAAQLEEFQKRQLPANFSDQIKKYFPIIRKYAKWYGLDWRLVIAQILKESHFKENARSTVGAVGLMQIMPQTASEITSELDIAYIAKDPRENITAGIYHMYKQLQYFPDADYENRLKLALAAYNCGPARVFDAQDIARFKRLNPNTWDAVKQCLPLLTADNWKLHLEVWPQGTPTFGFFYGFQETIDYVDDIYKKYTILKQMYRFDIRSISLDEANASS